MKMRISFFLLLLPLVGAALFLYIYPGSIHLDWQQYHMETSLTVFVLLTAWVLLALVYSLRVLRSLILLPFIMKQSYVNARQQEAHNALPHFYLSLLLDDRKSAKKLLNQVKHLKDNPLAGHLQADLAWRMGEEKKAFGLVEGSLHGKNGSDLARYHLICWHKAKGNLAESLTQAYTLLEVYPHSVWLLDTIFSLLLQTQQYEDIHDILERMEQEAFLSYAQLKRKRALVFTLQAEQLKDKASQDVKLHYLERAHMLAPESVGICLRLVDHLKAQGNLRHIKRALEETWTLNPHPTLAEAYYTFIGGSDPLKALEHTRNLTSYAPQHPASYQALIRAAINAQLWGEARSLLEEATAREGETPGLCYLWAEVEAQGSKETDKQFIWQQRAYALNPAWTCKECCVHPMHWHPLCPNCKSFDTIA